MLPMSYYLDKLHQYITSTTVSSSLHTYIICHVYRASCGCVHSMTLVFCCISLATLSFMFLFSAITYFRMSGVLSSLYFARVAHRFGLFHSLFDLSYGGRCLPKCRPLDPAYDRSEARRNCTPSDRLSVFTSAAYQAGLPCWPASAPASFSRRQEYN